jgi:hypothetical protein
MILTSIVLGLFVSCALVLCGFVLAFLDVAIQLSKPLTLRTPVTPSAQRRRGDSTVGRPTRLSSERESVGLMGRA